MEVPIFSMPHPADPFNGAHPAERRGEEAVIIDAVHGVRRWVESVLPASRHRVSQIFINGHQGNARDGIFRGAGGIIERELVCAEWRRVPNTRTPEFQANFDIILGVTPDERPNQKQ